MKKIAIVGFGFMGRTHYGNWKKIKGAKVAAICDSNLAQLTNKVQGNGKCADQSTDFTGIAIYDSFDKMLAEADVDIVDITLPTPLHPTMTAAALKAGKDVLCEKPMAVDAKTCDMMLAAAKKAGRKLMIAQCLRFQNEHVWVKDVIDSGKYGKVKAAEFGRYSMTPGWSAGGGKSWFLDESKSGGVALDLHIHDTDLVHWWFGMPKAVSSRAHLMADGVMDHISTTYLYDDKVVTGIGDWGCSPTFVFEANMRLAFEKATIVLDTRRKDAFLVYPEKGKPFTPKFSAEDGYMRELKAFLAWTNGKGEAPFCAKEARDSVAIVDAEKKSAKQNGKAVKA